MLSTSSESISSVPDAGASATSDPAPFDARACVARLPNQPGVYRMLDAAGQVLYVGKAKDLKRRVGSYFSRALNLRMQAMVARIADIQVTLTRTEGEALLLESDLIKAHQPRFNVLLRDDKSYPFILLSAHEYPRLSFHRGARRGKDRYFGPYPSATAVRETLHLLQKLFPVRQCRDSVFRNRTRPCLQYQIKRCSGPCVGLIDPAAYAEDVAATAKFLAGRADEVGAELAARMEAAAAALEFEQAAVLRDQIATLRGIQQRQYVTAANGGELDIIALAQDGGLHCVQVFFVRGGRNLGNKALFPRAAPDTPPATVLGAFLAQFYADKPIPPELLVSVLPEERAFLEAAFTERAGRAVRIRAPARGERVRWIELATHNAVAALQARRDSQVDQQRRLNALRELLDLPAPPQRLECFDISHTQGERMVAACVVFDETGPRKADYRRFHIDGIVPGDDYAALQQAVTRRYRRLCQEAAPLPDLVLIDGGPGQLAAAQRALADCPLENRHVPRLIGVAKGAARKVGAEQIWLPGTAQPLLVPAEAPALHLIQHIRDEAHRFALTGHRQRRDKARRVSVLEEIPGIGPRRRRALLTAFGGLRGLEAATIEDLARVEGIHRALAERIYHALRPTAD